VEARNLDVSIVVLATGKYQNFLPRLISSAEQYLTNLSSVYVLSDRPIEIDGYSDLVWLPWGHLQWPYSTLMRYEAITTYSQILQNTDVLLHIDADMYFNEFCDFTSVKGLIAVEHPGYVNQESPSLPYETNPLSNAYVPDSLGGKYFAGGVQGGATSAYLGAAFQMSQWIRQDLAQSIVPVWHDESIWNRYLVDSSSHHVFSADYCCPDTALSKTSRIIAITKDHAYYRDGGRSYYRYFSRIFAKILRTILPNK